MKKSIWIEINKCCDKIDNCCERINKDCRKIVELLIIGENKDANNTDKS